MIRIIDQGQSKVHQQLTLTFFFFFSFFLANLSRRGGGIEKRARLYMCVQLLREARSQQKWV